MIRLRNTPVGGLPTWTVGAVVIGNLIPVAGVVLLGWDAAQIMVLYWMETVVVGLFTVPRILTAQGPVFERAAFSGTPLALRLFLAVSFVVHFGVFCAGHGFFVTMLTALASSDDFSIGDPSIVLKWLLADWSLWLAAAAIAVVQAYLFFKGWVASGLWRTSEPKTEMGRPYGRIVVMQIAIIFGAFIMLALRLPAGLVLILCAGKMVLELTQSGLEGARPLPAPGVG